MATRAGFDLAVPRGLEELATAQTVVVPSWDPDLPVPSRAGRGAARRPRPRRPPRGAVPRLVRARRDRPGRRPRARHALARRGRAGPHGTRGQGAVRRALDRPGRRRQLRRHGRRAGLLPAPRAHRPRGRLRRRGGPPAGDAAAPRGHAGPVHPHAPAGRRGPGRDRRGHGRRASRAGPTARPRLVGRRAFMSRRTFTRRFRERTGESPGRGCCASGSSWPARCWRRPACRWTRSRSAAGWARRCRCGGTSATSSAPAPGGTGTSSRRRAQPVGRAALHSRHSPKISTVWRQVGEAVLAPRPAGPTSPRPVRRSPRPAAPPAHQVVVVVVGRAPPVDGLAGAGAQHVDLAGVGQRLQRAVDGGQADALADAAQLLVDLLGRAEVGRAVQQAGHRGPLAGGAHRPRRRHDSRRWLVGPALRHTVVTVSSHACSRPPRGRPRRRRCARGGRRPGSRRPRARAARRARRPPP